MGSNKVVAVLLFRLFATLALCVGAVAPVHAAEAPGKLTQRTIKVGGLDRSYLVYVPAMAPQVNGPAPLVIALHGGGGLASRFVAFTRFNAVADVEGFVVAYAQGYRKNWNDGRERTVSPAHVKNIDDTGFLVALIDDVAKAVATVDRKRVFVAGLSNGGMMALRVACEASQHVNAVAAIAGNLPERMRHRCLPEKPVSVLVMNGTNDPLVPWRGGEVRFGLRRLGKVLSTERTLAYWAEKNRCGAAPLESRLPDTVPTDGTEIRLFAFKDCDGGTEVVLYGVERGGHGWPGGSQYLPIPLIGKVSRDIDATQVIWAFFKRQARR